MIKKFLTAWHPMRLLRMGVSIAAIVQGIELHDYLIIGVGILFGIATYFNVGCCSYPDNNCKSDNCSVKD